MIKKTIIIIAAALLYVVPLLGQNAQTQKHCHSSVSKVKPGVEVLRDKGFDVLIGKKVGLVTNPTGVDSHLKSTIDILHEAEGVKLTALYAPEH